MAESKEIEAKRTADIARETEENRRYVHPRMAIWSVDDRIVLRREADYHKIFTLDSSIDRGSIEEAMENGILTLTLHEREAAKPRKIPVRRG